MTVEATDVADPTCPRCVCAQRDNLLL